MVFPDVPGHGPGNRLLSAGQTVDPFLGRVTIPPPTTGQIISPGTAQPYYQNGAPQGVAPQGVAPPATQQRIVPLPEGSGARTPITPAPAGSGSVERGCCDATRGNTR